MKHSNKPSLNTLQVKTTWGDVLGWVVVALIALAFWLVVLGASYGTLKLMFWFFLDRN